MGLRTRQGPLVRAGTHTLAARRAVETALFRFVLMMYVPSKHVRIHLYMFDGFPWLFWNANEEVGDEAV